jgi:hypothetical protein
MRKSQPLITQAGGLLALVCFFLPWSSCLDEQKSGVEIGGYAWISFLSAGAILMAVHYFRSTGTLSKAKGVVRGAAVVALLSLMIVYVQAHQRFGAFLNIEFGSVGTLIGFIAALYGSLFLEDES